MLTIEEKTRLYQDKDAEGYFPLKITHRIFAHKFTVGPWLRENIGKTKEDWMNFMVMESVPYIAFKSEEDRNLFKLVWSDLLKDRAHLDWS